jgi:hypothetical protein
LAHLAWRKCKAERTPASHWSRLAQWVPARDHHTLDDDAEMFFALNNALLDASIAGCDMKPTTRSGLSPERNLGRARQGRWTAQKWIPYQPAISPAPPFPEYISGHSAFGAGRGHDLGRLDRKRPLWGFGDTASRKLEDRAGHNAVTAR